MAVSVTLTRASRPLIIFGSGTFSTRTSCVPCQQAAFMCCLLVRNDEGQVSGPAPRILVVVRRRVARGEGLDGGLVDVAVALGLVRVASARLSLGGRDFTRFHDLLEAVQIFLNLLPRL